jgi:hypothetical protein
MPAKKTTPNKSAFIRSQPASLSAAQVVAKAKAEGIKIAPVLVYKVRGRAKAKKPAPVAARTVAKAGGKSKAAFVRGHADLSAKEVVAKAKAEGIKLTEGYVYNVRTYDKKAGKQGAATRTRTQGAPAARSIAPGSSTESLLRAVAAEIGLGRAIEMLEVERSRVRAAIGA